MVTPTTIKAKRRQHEIAGDILCKKVGYARSKLTGIERGYTLVSPEELLRIDAALDELIRTKSVLQQTATELGWPVEVSR